MSSQFDKELDCSGLVCPMPIVETKKAIDKLQLGQVLKMISTDPGSLPDIEAWTARTGHQLLNHDKDSDKYIFYIKKTK
jgi:tRNA 2-thiouridine synthesizing protein A